MTEEGRTPLDESSLCQEPYILKPICVSQTILVWERQKCVSHSWGKCQQLKRSMDAEWIAGKEFQAHVE